MVTQELSKAAVEINSIFEFMPLELLNKIPEDFKSLFKEIACTNYNFIYDKSKTLYNQKLLPETKGIIAFIYKEYLCNSEQKEEYVKICDKYIQNIEIEKIGFDGIFNNTADIENNINKSLDLYVEESFIKKIIKKIRRIFS